MAQTADLQLDLSRAVEAHPDATREMSDRRLPSDPAGRCPVAESVGGSTEIPTALGFTD